MSHCFLGDLPRVCSSSITCKSLILTFEIEDSIPPFSPLSQTSHEPNAALLSLEFSRLHGFPVHTCYNRTSSCSHISANLIKSPASPQEAEGKHLACHRIVEAPRLASPPRELARCSTASSGASGPRAAAGSTGSRPAAGARPGREGLGLLLSFVTPGLQSRRERVLIPTSGPSCVSRWRSAARAGQSASVSTLSPRRSAGPHSI